MGTRRGRAFALCLAAVAVCAFPFAVFAGEDVFSWRQCAGATLRVLLPRHPCAESLKRGLGDFESVTGVQAVFLMYPEEMYPARLEAAFAEEFSHPDVYMIHTRLPWRFTTEERMLPLDAFVRTPAQTRQVYNIDDYFPSVLGAFRRYGNLMAVPTAFTGDPESPEAVWGLAISPGSENPGAAWLLVQYFTSLDFQSASLAGHGPLEPPRRSLFGAAREK